MSVHRVKGGYSVRWRQGDSNKSRTFPKRRMAERFDEKMKERRLMGGLDLLASEQPFQDIAEEFWTSYNRTVSDGTRVRNRRYLTSLIDHFNGYRLCDVTAPELETYRLHLEKQGKGAPTIRHIFFLLSKLFRHCIRMGYIQSNPVQAIDKPSAPRTRLIQPFPPERVEAVRGWFLERGKLEDATLISVLAYAGPRPAEAYEHLTWADVGDKLIFRGEKTKRDRTTTLLEPLRADLTAWRKINEGCVAGGPSGAYASNHVVRIPAGPIFDWTTARYNSWRDDGAWRKMVDDLDLLIAGKRARPYDLRHAFATLMLGEGLRLPELAEQMGNSLNVCSRWYAHLDNIGERMGASERIWHARGVLDQRGSDFPNERYPDPVEAM